MIKQAVCLNVIYFICIRLCFVFAAFPYPIVKVASGRPHNSGPVAFGCRPTVVKRHQTCPKHKQIQMTYMLGCAYCIFYHIPFVSLLELFVQRDPLPHVGHRLLEMQKHVGLGSHVRENFLLAQPYWRPGGLWAQNIKHTKSVYNVVHV